ncbi:uncharacterized protein PHACADRAFT_265966, partial [Phanerochaete carnosa HHB-10118-sp]
ALPRIVSVFNALDLATWVAAAYFLTQAGLMLCVGQLVDTIPIKTVYVISIVVFELGSVLCGAAPSMRVLIFGRAVAGCGAAGITICSVATIATFTRLEDRPALFGAFGALLAVASIIGPLLDHVSWRWCFYINLPIGGLSVVIMLLWLPYRKPHNSVLAGRGLLSRLNHALDWVGTVLCLGFSACLLLGLEWGGSVKPWKSPAVIAPLCIAGVAIVAFVVWEGLRGSKALVPYSIFHRRTQCGASLEAFWLLTSLIVSVYYLPLWYQVNGRSSEQSGINLLPLMLSFVVSSGVASYITTATGRYWHIMLVTPLLTVAGAALIFTSDASTSNAKLIGFQILMGVRQIFFFCGSYQSSFVAVQAEWADEVEETTRASAILMFISNFGGLIGLSVAGTIYNNRLSSELSRVQGLTPELVDALKQSVTVIATLPDGLREHVREASIRAITAIFLIPLICSALGAVCALAIRNHNVKERAKLAEGFGGVAVM